MLKAFYATFYGWYIRGNVIVIAETVEEAFEEIKAKLKEYGYSNPPAEDRIKIEEIKELNIDTKQCIIINDGDY